MSKTAVRNASHDIIGYIVELGDGRQKAVDECERLLGYFDPATNLTRDRFQLLFGLGNQLEAMIRWGQ